MGLLSHILKDIPTVGMARERIALAEQKYEVLEREAELRAMMQRDSGRSRLVSLYKRAMMLYNTSLP